jgi:anti-sigma B factor antagonist
MAQASLAHRYWDFEVERGPDWLFVRPHRLSTSDAGSLRLTDEVWHLLEQHLMHRLVLEMDDIGHLDSNLVGQLLSLFKRIHARDGMMRVCGLSSANADVLHACRLDSHFPCYADRGEAVMGQSHPRQPR